MTNQTISLKELTPEQIEQIKTIIEAFKAKNKLEQMQNMLEEKDNDFNTQEININDLFFSSEILTDFNRGILYGQRT